MYNDLLLERLAAALIDAALTMQTRLVNTLVVARRQELSATVRAIESARSDSAAPAFDVYDRVAN